MARIVLVQNSKLQMEILLLCTNFQELQKFEHSFSTKSKTYCQIQRFMTTHVGNHFNSWRPLSMFLSDHILCMVTFSCIMDVHSFLTTRNLVNEIDTEIIMIQNTQSFINLRIPVTCLVKKHLKRRCIVILNEFRF